MQKVGDQMNAAGEAGAANAVSGPSQCPGEASRDEHNGKSRKPRLSRFPRSLATSRPASRAISTKPHQPVTAEIGVQEYRLENAAIGQYACERLIADRLRHQYEPGRTRQQRQHQADPSDPRQAPADRGPQLCTTVEGQRAGCAMKTLKNAAPAAESVAAKWTARTKISGSSTPYSCHALRRARSLAADMEGEASLRLVRIDREHVPIHPVSPGRQSLQTDTHGAAADLGLAEIDARALGVGHLHRAE